MRTLVVDDETDVRDLFEQRFRRERKTGEIEFAFAFSGDEALHYLHSAGHEAVLILSDINMPGMTGLELLRQIRKEFINPPLVVMMITAYGDEDNYSQAMSLGADGFLTKPLDFNRLKEKLKSIQNNAG